MLHYNTTYQKLIVYKQLFVTNKHYYTSVFSNVIYVNRCVLIWIWIRIEHRLIVDSQAYSSVRIFSRPWMAHECFDFIFAICSTTLKLTEFYLSPIKIMPKHTGHSWGSVFKHNIWNVFALSWLYQTFGIFHVTGYQCKQFKSTTGYKCYKYDFSTINVWFKFILY